MATSANNWIWIFPLFFAAMWLAITSLLGAISGWYGLMRRFPDRPEKPIVRLSFLYGSMRGVHFNGILVLSVCPSGLRVGIWRIFGPFSRNFFVPWSQLHVERRNRLLWKLAVLSFGASGPRLKILSHVGDRLAQAAGPRWPEAGVFSRETVAQAAMRIGIQWLAVSLFASAFFVLASRVDTGPSAPPIIVCVLFPFVAFGIFSLVRFAASIKR